MEVLTPEERANIEEVVERLERLGGRIGSFAIDHVTVYPNGAVLYLDWDNDVDPRDVDEDIMTVFQASPELLYSYAQRLLLIDGAMRA